MGGMAVERVCTQSVLGSRLLDSELIFVRPVAVLDDDTSHLCSQLQ